MPVQEVSAKSCVSVSEMSELCQISRSHWYDLIAQGVFPQPVLHPTTKRPMYDRGMIEKCLEIKQTGIGANGLPVLFNRRRKAGQPKAQRKLAENGRQDHGDLLDCLRGLGLTPTAQAVGDALAALFPTGHAGFDQGDVIRKLFLHLQGRKT